MLLFLVSVQMECLFWLFWSNICLHSLFCQKIRSGWAGCIVTPRRLLALMCWYAGAPKRTEMVPTLIYRVQISYIRYKASSKRAGSEARKKCHFSNCGQKIFLTHEAPLNSKGACPKGFVKNVIPFTWFGTSVCTKTFIIHHFVNWYVNYIIWTPKIKVI